MKGQWNKIENMPREGVAFVIELDNKIIDHDVKWWGRDRRMFARFDEKDTVYTVVAGSVVDIPPQYIARALELPE